MLRVNCKNDTDFKIWITAEMLAHELFIYWDNYVILDDHKIELIYTSVYSRYDYEEYKSVIFRKTIDILRTRYRIKDIKIPKPTPLKSESERIQEITQERKKIAIEKNKKERGNKLSNELKKCRE